MHLIVALLLSTKYYSGFLLLADINKNFLKFNLDPSFFKFSAEVIFELLDLMHAEGSEVGNLVLARGLLVITIPQIGP